MQVGSELRIGKDGEVSVSNATSQAAASPVVAEAVFDYRFDPQTGEHVLRLLEPVAENRRNRPRWPGNRGE
jgi:hypothetical protein